MASNPELVDKYLRAIAKRALPIFQSNNFTYFNIIENTIVGCVPTEDELYIVLKEIYYDFLKKHNNPRFRSVRLGRFQMFNSMSPIGIEVLLNIADHGWNWYPEETFGES